MKYRKIQRFCFSLDNFTNDEYDRICNWIRTQTVYGIISKDRASHRIHGYCNLGRLKRKVLNLLKSTFVMGPNAVIEIVVGSHSDEYYRTIYSDYCEFFEWGISQYSGRRNDLHGVATAMVVRKNC